jgi:flavin reductase (DIM6/NTAB) family NADH-FMN oxidoreductase RutF
MRVAFTPAPAAAGPTEPAAPAPARAHAALRQVLARFATGVAIVTCHGARGEPVGLTCNSFASLSLAPPLATWALQSHSPSRAAFLAATAVGINVLAHEQRPLAERFSRRGPAKFDGVALRAPQSVGAAPEIEGAIAVLHCSPIAWHEYGDHLLFVVRVDRFHQHGGRPLLFVDGQFA